MSGQFLHLLVNITRSVTYPGIRYSFSSLAVKVNLANCVLFENERSKMLNLLGKLFNLISIV